MPRFSGSNLTCVRGDRTVFAGLDFALERGEGLYLTGPNGSGKSSLLRLMAGLLKPALGVIAWGDEPIVEDPDSHHARITYVGHQPPFKGLLTVAENLEFWAGMHGAPDGARAADALAAFGLAHLSDLPARFLSAGQRRRLDLARLIACPAELWLLDEPTTSLDKAGAATFVEVLAAHIADGGRAAVATHDPLPPGSRELVVGRAPAPVDTA